MMRDELVKYPHIGRHGQLLNRGRELLGKHIYWTEKRDGQNIRIYYNEEVDEVWVGSRNNDRAKFYQQVEQAPEWPALKQLAQEHHNWVIFCEHMMKGHGPTRIEEPRDHNYIVLIDIFRVSPTDSRFLPYNFIHQMACHLGVPIVSLLDIRSYATLADLKKDVDEFLDWAKEEKREGVVGKVYDEYYQIFFKEKIDLPKPKKECVPQQMPNYPPLPPEKVDKCLDRARVECERNGEDIYQPKYFMPRFAAHVKTEQREHFYSAPGAKLFQYYQDYLDVLDKEDELEE